MLIFYATLVTTIQTPQVDSGQKCIEIVSPDCRQVPTIYNTGTLQEEAPLIIIILHDATKDWSQYNRSAKK